MIALNSGHIGITALHTAYVQLTGYDIALNFERERFWFEWMKRGFTEPDLRLVVDYLRKFIKSGERHPASLLFRNLIADVDKFEEDRNLYRSMARKKPVNYGRAQVSRDTGRQIEDPDTVRTPGAVLGKTPEEMQAFFDKCKREAGL